MLSRARRTAGRIAAALLSAISVAEAAPSGLSRPERLTAGASDHILGVLDATGRRLYYVDNGRSTYQILAQDTDGGAPALLFDDAADATWPRPSPDGRRLLYISHQTASAGQLCVRDLMPAKPGEPPVVGERRCLTDERLAVFQAQWFPDGRSVAAVVRAGLGGDLTLRRLPIEGGDPGTSLLPEGCGDAADCNPGSPSISPDGRWIAYVPMRRVAAEVPPNIAAVTGRTIVLRRIGDGGAPIPVRLDLPGTGGFPVFSADGKWLYFTQFLNDTRLDGVTDGNDAGVVMRVPFDGAGDRPVDPARVEQLTSAAWNCQYPAPAASRLIVSCLFEGVAHVYALPLEGAVPPGWTRDRIDDEIDAASDPWDQLLLLGRRLAAEDVPARARTMLQMTEQHLRLGEFNSAEFYARRLVEADGRGDGGRLAKVLLEVVAQRRAERALSRGQLSAAFVSETEKRLARLRDDAKSAPPAAAAMARALESEILDTVPDLDGLDEPASPAARPGPLRALDDIAIDKVTEPLVLRAVAERAVAAYRDRNERDPCLALLLKLAEHPSLSHRERLRIAELFLTELARGRPERELPDLLAAWEKEADPYSDLGFRLDLARRLLGLTPKAQEEVRARVFELYRKHRDFDRRHALVDATIRRAASADNDYLLYQFADTWVSWVDQDKPERRVAESLYRQVVLERAYIERARGDVGDARGHFYGVTLQTDSLEAHVGFIEGRFREGKSEAEILAEYQQRFAQAPADPVLAFARAYLVARRLPGTADPAAHARLVDEARGLLRAAGRLGGRVEAQLLLAFVEHQRFLRARAREAAMEAVGHYQLALDLARERPRARAAALSGLAVVQAAVGNHAIALRWFTERDRLPWSETSTGRAAEMRHRMEKARSLFHLDRDKQAAAEIDACLAIVDGTPALARFLPIALDRAALYHLGAGDPATALARYDRLMPLVDGREGPDAAHDRFTARLGRAAAAIGAGQPARAVVDLDAIRSQLDRPAVLPSEKIRETDRLILAGLRAEAEAALGHLDVAEAAARERRDLLAARLERDKLDETRLDLAQAEARLAALAHRRNADGEALRRMEAALAHADAWSRSTNTPVHELGLAILAGYAELHLQAGVPLRELREDLAGRLRSAEAALRDQRLPAWAAMRERLAVYLTQLRLAGGR